MRVAAGLASEEAPSGASAGAENAFCGSTLSLRHKANMQLAFLCEGGSSGLVNSVSISLHGSSYLKKGERMKAIFFLPCFKMCLRAAMQVSVAKVCCKWIPRSSLYRSTTVNEINKVEQYKRETGD